MGSVRILYVLSLYYYVVSTTKSMFYFSFDTLSMFFVDKS